MYKNLRERIWFMCFCLIHRCPLSVIEWWQVAHLRELTRHAFRHVPMWHPLLSKTAQGSMGSFNELLKVPLTNRDFYIGKMIEEYIDGSRRFKRVWKETSGTSGKPF